VRSICSSILHRPVYVCHASVSIGWCQERFVLLSLVEVLAVVCLWCGWMINACEHNDVVSGLSTAGASIRCQTGTWSLPRFDFTSFTAIDSLCVLLYYSYYSQNCIAFRQWYRCGYEWSFLTELCCHIYCSPWWYCSTYLPCLVLSQCLECYNGLI